MSTSTLRTPTTLHLHADHLTYGYPGSSAMTIHDLSLHLAAGTSVGLIGANGAGKSTLLWLLTGLLTPQTGRVWLQEADGSTRTGPLRQAVGLLFQDADDQLFMPTVLEDVAFAPQNKGMSVMMARDLAAMHLERVGAWHLRDRAPFTLSGGEKRRVALAAVLAGEPEILLLDEPSSGLDPRGRRLFMALVADLTQSCLLASHDLGMVRALCSRVIVMHGGVVLASGETERLLGDDGLMQVAGLESCP
ncbi:MAG: ABC transporter ATP-binding protein [Magnetococcales bacterium]|nr:ABC transporter ATP-binding protein [Magnetococcales bacterium]